MLTETVFGWPGMGQLLVDALFARDYPVVQGIVLTFSTLFILVNLAVDVLYGADRPAHPLRVSCGFGFAGAATVLARRRGRACRARPAASDTNDQSAAAMWQRFCRNRGAVVGLLVLLLFFVRRAGSRRSPRRTTPNRPASTRSCCEPSRRPPARHRPPRPRHPGPAGLWRALLAADRLRRGRASGLVIGVPLGAVSGFYGGWLDLIIQRVIDVLLSLPGLPAGAVAGRRARRGHRERHPRRRAGSRARLRAAGARLDAVDPLARLRRGRARWRAPAAA